MDNDIAQLLQEADLLMRDIAQADTVLGPQPMSGSSPPPPPFFLAKRPNANAPSWIAHGNTTAMSHDLAAPSKREKQVDCDCEDVHTVPAALQPPHDERCSSPADLPLRAVATRFVEPPEDDDDTAPTARAVAVLRRANSAASASALGQPQPAARRAGGSRGRSGMRAGATAAPPPGMSPIVSTCASAPDILDSPESGGETPPNSPSRLAASDSWVTATPAIQSAQPHELPPNVFNPPQAQHSFAAAAARPDDHFSSDPGKLARLPADSATGSPVHASLDAPSDGRPADESQQPDMRRLYTAAHVVMEIPHTSPVPTSALDPPMDMLRRISEVSEDTADSLDVIPKVSEASTSSGALSPTWQQAAAAAFATAATSSPHASMARARGSDDGHVHQDPHPAAAVPPPTAMLTHNHQLRVPMMDLLHALFASIRDAGASGSLHGFLQLNDALRFFACVPQLLTPRIFDEHDLAAVLALHAILSSPTLPPGARYPGVFIDRAAQRAMSEVQRRLASTSPSAKHGPSAYAGVTREPSGAPNGAGCSAGFGGSVTPNSASGRVRRVSVTSHESGFTNVTSISRMVNARMPRMNPTRKREDDLRHQMPCMMSPAPSNTGSLSSPSARARGFLASSPRQLRMASPRYRLGDSTSRGTVAWSAPSPKRNQPPRVADHDAPPTLPATRTTRGEPWPDIAREQHEVDGCFAHESPTYCSPWRCAWQTVLEHSTDTCHAGPTWPADGARAAAGSTTGDGFCSIDVALGNECSGYVIAGVLSFDEFLAAVQDMAALRLPPVEASDRDNHLPVQQAEALLRQFIVPAVLCPTSAQP